MNNMTYEIIKTKNDFYFYKYSSKPPENPHKLIYQYYFDNFDKNDMENAHIILFIGKTGDGKTTAINALFNIIKLVKIEDKYRFILIKEKNKELGQAESQTDGLHLYYIKDNFNNPIIIIDSQGFGDTKGIKYDELLREAFEYAFKNIIKHINIICFTVKSTDCRLDIFTKYIFSSVTSLFAKDLNKNFIFLTTFANNSTLELGPPFIDSIRKNSQFNNIINKLDKNWYYNIDSLSLLSDYVDNITNYSFKQMNDLYNEKIKNSENKNFEKTLQVFKFKHEIKDDIKIIINLKEDIKLKKNEIENNDKKILELEEKLSLMKMAIEREKFLINQIYIPDKDYYINLIKEKRDKRIYKLEHEYEERVVKELRYDGETHTYCNYCESNCHENCNCYLSFLILCNECVVFPGFSSKCNYCGHDKDDHTIRGYKKWVSETKRYKINNDYEIEREYDDYWERYYKISDEYDKKIQEKNNRQIKLNNICKKKLELEKKLESCRADKTRFNCEIKKAFIQIKNLCLDLLKISNSINALALNTFHFEIENKYIELLINQINESNINMDEENIKFLNASRQYNHIFLEMIKITEQEINNLTDEQLVEKINNLILLNN